MWTTWVQNNCSYFKPVYALRISSCSYSLKQHVTYSKPSQACVCVCLSCAWLIGQFWGIRNLTLPYLIFLSFLLSSIIQVDIFICLILWFLTLSLIVPISLSWTQCLVTASLNMDHAAKTEELAVHIWNTDVGQLVGERIYLRLCISSLRGAWFIFNMVHWHTVFEFCWTKDIWWMNLEWK